MKYLVTIVLIAITTFVVSDAACFFKKAEQNEPLKGCLYKGKLYPPGKTWRTRSCLKCGCSTDGYMRCCQTYGIPFSDDSNCKFKFDRKACEYVLIPNEDPEKRCTGYGMVG
ncbi:beta-microseminoprotein-like [Rana temporaria]|uniref:beta-microseminoprotein-like n=1 Tax=Rana temporaria TaxID=8407 RepID=UPI001AAD2E01|nr:beta-microseminoprotein-like [Rana temporaria]